MKRHLEVFGSASILDTIEVRRIAAVEVIKIIESIESVVG